MRTDLLLRIIGVAAVALLLLATWPQLLGLQRYHVLAQLTALRGLLVVAAVGGALTFGVAAWRSRVPRRFAVAVMVPLLAVAVLNVAVLASRGLGGGSSTNASADLTVFVWNTFWDRPGAELIAEFALAHDVDVLALPETSRAAAQEIARLMGEGGRSMQVFVLAFHEVITAQSTALLVSSSLGAYEIDEAAGSTPRLPTVVARPVNGSGPTLVAAHPVAPLPGYYRYWEPGLAWLAERCRAGEVVVAGDLNATLDHFEGLRDAGADLGACRDGARATGSAALGTWPSQVPPLLGAPIDHIMATEEWEFVEFRVVRELDWRGSDHRALLARLRRLR